MAPLRRLLPLLLALPAEAWHVAVRHARAASRTAPLRAVAPSPSAVQLEDADRVTTAEVGWNRASLLAGYQNPTELSAREVRCDDLPADLVGTYYRNGHARFIGYDGRKVRHPFDADGMITAISLDGSRGSAVLRQRYIATEMAIQEREAGKTLFAGQFGNPRPAWEGGLEIKNLANTNCLYHADKLLALWEGSRPHLVDPLSLATLKVWDVDGLVGSGPTDSFSAHPRREPDGGFVNFAYFGNPMSGLTKVRFWDFGADAFALRAPAQEVEVPGFGLYHDFVATENWLICVAAPTSWGPKDKPLEAFKGTLELLGGQRSIVSMIDYDTSGVTVAHLIPRDPSSGRERVSIELDSFFAFHHANAYEDPATGQVVLDTVTAEKLTLESTPSQSNKFIIEEIDYETEAPMTNLVRYTLDVRQKTFTKRRLSSRLVEFPSVAPRVSGRPHRFVYCSAGGTMGKVCPTACIFKVDTVDGRGSQLWAPETEHQTCGEVIFTPRATATADAPEDAGYLLTLCFDGRDGTSSLLVFDAEHVDQGPVVRLPVSTPEVELSADAQIAGPGHGLHATFVPGLAPSLEQIEEAERTRHERGGRFLTDSRIAS